MKHFLARFLGETSWQDLCERFLQTGSLHKISKYERFVDIPKEKKIIQFIWELSSNFKKDKFWFQIRSQNLVSKMKPILTSPNEKIEAAFQKLKLKMASVKRNTNGPKRKEMPRRQKKISQ
jgi:hypothetical protein